MTSLASCRLSVAGHIVADTAASVGSTPTALADLSVSWGRDDNLAQPQAATLTASLILPADPGRYLDMLTIGKPVSVSAHVPLWQPSTPRTLAPATAKPHAATWDGQHLKPTAHDAATLAYPPAPRSLAFDAWDALPTIQPGQTWNLTATVTIPQGMNVELCPAYYSSPRATATLGPALSVATTSGTHTLTHTLTTSHHHGGQWLGLALRLYPCGQTWQATNPAPWHTHPHTWDYYAAATITAATLTPPTRATARVASVYAGRITDTRLTWKADHAGPVLTITAADLLTELAQQRIGSTPYGEDTLAARVDKLLDAAGRSGLTRVIDPAPATRHLTPADIDSQPLADLLAKAADSAGAILWASTHATTGPYLYIEDPYRRAAHSRLVLPATGPATVSAPHANILNARHLLADATVTRSTAQHHTVTRLTWQQVGTDTTGTKITTTAQKITLSDPADIQTNGYREISKSTNLTRYDEAHAVAQQIRDLATGDTWVLDSLTWDTRLNADHANPHTLAALLDSTTRTGAPVTITNLPAWIPGHPTRTAYLDGGTYTWDGQAWTLALTLTTADANHGGARWNETPPALTWNRCGAITFAHIGRIAI